MEQFTAIVLAAGSGRRMNSKIHKQYLLLKGKPVLYYSLWAFEESPVSSVVLVTAAGEEAYCRREIIERYGIKKVKAIAAGGRERADSVYEGLKAAGKTDYVMIHDGARPFIDGTIIESSMEAVKKYQACVVGMPVKDTIKIVDENNYVTDTPRRDRVWQIQTPQTFSYSLIFPAYRDILKKKGVNITDDAMVLEYMTGRNVKVIEGSYRNIKITTPEDIIVAEAFMRQNDSELQRQTV